MINRQPHKNLSSIGIDWDRTSKQTLRTLPVRSSAIFRRPWGRNNSHPDFSAQRIYPVARVLELPTCPTLPFCVIINTQDFRAEALLNIRCIVKGYHLSCCCCWQFHCLHKYNFCYQNFSVKAQCNHFPFFEVKRLAHGTNI